MKFLILFLVTFMVYNDVAMENIVIQVHQEVGSGCNNGDIDEGRNNGDIDEDDGTTTTLGPTTPEYQCGGIEPAVLGNEYTVGSGDDHEIIFHYISKTHGDFGCKVAPVPDYNMTKFRLDMRNCYGYDGLMWVDLSHHGDTWTWKQGNAIEGDIDEDLGGDCSLLDVGEGAFNYKSIPCNSADKYPYLCGILQ